MAGDVSRISSTKNKTNKQTNKKQKQKQKQAWKRPEMSNNVLTTAKNVKLINFEKEFEMLLELALETL